MGGRRWVVLAAVIVAIGAAPRPSAAVEPTPSFQWVHQLGWTYEDDGMDIAVDHDGNVAVVGFTDGVPPGSPDAAAGGYDVLVAVYSPSGARNWVRQLGGAGDDYGRAVDFDPDGNVVVIGYTASTLPGALNANAGSNDAFIAKYDIRGNRLWVRHFGGQSSDVVLSGDIDSAGNIAIAGATTGTMPGFPQPWLVGKTGFVAKLAPDGGLIWSRHLGTTAASELVGVAFDTQGNVHVVGRSSTSVLGAPEEPAGYNDVLLAKYSSAGSLLWAHLLGGDDEDNATGLAVDASGRVVVIGNTRSLLPGSQDPPPAFSTAAFVAQYTASGDKSWVRQPTGVGANDVAFFGDAPFLVGGASTVTLTKLSSMGAVEWTTGIGAPGRSSSGRGVALDAYGNAYLTGHTFGTLVGSAEPNPCTCEFNNTDLFVTKVGSPETHVTVHWSEAEYQRIQQLMTFYGMTYDELTKFGVYVLAFINAIDPSPQPTPVVLAPPGDDRAQTITWYPDEIALLAASERRWALTDESAHRWGFMVLSFIAAIQGH